MYTLATLCEPSEHDAAARYKTEDSRYLVIDSDNMIIQ